MNKLWFPLLGIGAILGVFALAGGSAFSRAPIFSYEKTLTQTVLVDVTGPLEPSESGAPKPRSGGLGTGFFVSKEGFIVTNYHVIDDAAEIWIYIKDQTAFKATVVGFDKFADIAVLKINPPKNVNVITWGRSSEVRYGDVVIGLGNPQGLGWSFTKGIVSDPNRDGANLLTPVIQSDAAINHGNSGGPLYNENGEVIAINEAIASDTQTSGSIGISLSIPSDYAKIVVNKIIKGETIKHGRVGISIGTHVSETSELKVEDGIEVTGVDPDGPVAKLLKEEDVITAIDGKKVTDFFAFQHIIMNMQPNTKITLTVRRGDQETDVPVTLAPATHPSDRKEEKK